MAEKKRVHLFNCDKTYDLLVVDALLRAIQDKLPFNFTVSKHYFSLHDMSNICDNTISKLHIDFAFLVVHANESRLSINERNVDIGYTRVYRALLDAAGEKVVVVIGADNNYKSQEEEDENVLSRWALRVVNLQLKEEFRDGRKSFVFSWNEKHRAIHEEALLHFFDPEKAGVKFVRQSEIPVKPKSDAASAVHVVEKSFPSLDVGTCDVVDSMASEDKTGTVDFMVLCSDQSATAVISHMYCLPGMRTPPDVHVGSPTELKSHLEGNSVSLCAIGLKASELKEIALSNEWEESAYGDLLKTAHRVAERIVVVLMLPQSEEKQITEKVELLLGEKGVVLWCRGKILEQSGPCAVEAAMPCPETSAPNEKLMLKTSIRCGRISYEEHDVVERKEGWKPPADLVSDLLKKYKSVSWAELEIYYEESSGDIRAVVKESAMSRVLSGYKLTVMKNLINKSF